MRSVGYGATVVTGASVVAGASVVTGAFVLDVGDSSPELFISTMISTTTATTAKRIPMMTPAPIPLFCVIWTAGVGGVWGGVGASDPGAGGVTAADGSIAFGSVPVEPLLLTCSVH